MIDLIIRFKVLYIIDDGEKFRMDFIAEGKRCCISFRYNSIISRSNILHVLCGDIQCKYFKMPDTSDPRIICLVIPVMQKIRHAIDRNIRKFMYNNSNNSITYL
jgi:hypothetical protein